MLQHQQQQMEHSGRRRHTRTDHCDNKPQQWPGEEGGGWYQRMDDILTGNFMLKIRDNSVDPPVWRLRKCPRFLSDRQATHWAVEVETSAAETSELAFGTDTVHAGAQGTLTMGCGVHGDDGNPRRRLSFSGDLLELQTR
eukprot:gene24384-35814_t